MTMKIGSGGLLSTLLILLFFACGSSLLQRGGEAIPHRPHHHAADSDVISDKERLGDIAINRHDGPRQKRQIYRHARRWENNTMFYYFDDNLNWKGRDAVERAIRYLSARTCINFYEDSSAKNRVRFYESAPCFSQFGMKGGEQSISVCRDLPYPWYNEGDMMHEIMHSLGILHMHNRNDRDDYIRVISSSVQEALQGDYEKSSADNVINYTPYEYGSIMHYSARAGTKPDHGDTNIPADVRYYWTTGSRIASFYDIMMINRLYGCSNRCENGIKCANEGVQNPKKCGECICPYGYGGRFCDERPPGCGATLEASSHWKTEKFTFKDSNVRMDEDQGYKVCNHWIQAPLGKQIEIRVIGMPGFMCQYGCPAYAIEPKILSDKRITNPRFCCFQQLNQTTLISKLNPTPIFSYSSNAYSILSPRPSEFTFQYRYS